ncbi:MAG: type I phosphomannose isomerase catalytic subunit [Christensenellaceae bacterium]|jgi:mannose-6-phosphate isomerase
MRDPIFFKPILKEKVWGGTKILPYLKMPVTKEGIGEAWLLSDVLGSESYTKNDPSITLNALTKMYGAELVGTEIYKRYENQFPLLCKLIDAKEHLSVQVHPDKAYAAEKAGINSKEELWYILEAEPEAKLILGLQPDVRKPQIKKAIEENNVQSILKRIPVKPGDFVMVPAGTVHAILGDIFLLEISESSDTTFRFYDWDRKEAGTPRELHISESLAALREEATEEQDYSKKTKRNGAYIQHGPKIDCFSSDSVLLNGRYCCDTDERSFAILIVLGGAGTLAYDDKEVNLQAGDTTLIPAKRKNIAVQGEGIHFLHTYMNA